jgi:F-type H+-transporting ATPase subunit a
MDAHISFVPETIFQFAGIEFTNSLITGFLTVAIIFIFFAILRAKLSVFKPGKFQLVMESILGMLYGMVEDIMGAKNAKKYFGFVLTFFVFVLFSNLLALTPIVPSLGTLEARPTEESATCLLTGKCVVSTEGIIDNYHFVPVLRAPTADLSNTLALAIISILVTNAIGVMTMGKGFLKRYINFSSPIDFFLGIFEMISELGKIVSFAFRLFGNIFAGEVLLAILTALTFGLATLPFLGLEIFLGTIQAFVFFMLTTVFIALATEAHD